MALSSTVLMSSHVSSWTNPTWFASMKHGSHIMLQRLVRSTVSTEPRPCWIVLLPWLCSFSSLCARMSRPGNTSSRCLKNVGVHRHHVLEVAVDRAVLHHQDLAVALEDGRLDLADLLVEQDADVLLAVENRLARLARAGRAERVGLARPAERRLGLLVGLQQRLVGPLRRERRVLVDLVQIVEHHPGAVGGDRQPLLDVLDRRVHALNNRGQTR